MKKNILKTVFIVLTALLMSCNNISNNAEKECGKVKIAVGFNGQTASRATFFAQTYSVDDIDEKSIYVFTIDGEDEEPILQNGDLSDIEDLNVDVEKGCSVKICCTVNGSSFTGETEYTGQDVVEVSLGSTENTGKLRFKLPDELQCENLTGSFESYIFRTLPDDLDYEYLGYEDISDGVGYEKSCYLKYNRYENNVEFNDENSYWYSFEDGVGSRHTFETGDSSIELEEGIYYIVSIPTCNVILHSIDVVQIVNGYETEFLPQINTEEYVMVTFYNDLLDFSFRYNEDTEALKIVKNGDPEYNGSNGMSYKLEELASVAVKAGSKLPEEIIPSIEDTDGASFKGWKVMSINLSDFPIYDSNEEYDPFTTIDEIKDFVVTAPCVIVTDWEYPDIDDLMETAAEKAKCLSKNEISNPSEDIKIYNTVVPKDEYSIVEFYCNEELLGSYVCPMYIDGVHLFPSSVCGAVFLDFPNLYTLMDMDEETWYPVYEFITDSIESQYYEIFYRRSAGDIYDFHDTYIYSDTIWKGCDDEASRIQIIDYEDASPEGRFLYWCTDLSDPEVTKYEPGDYFNVTDNVTFYPVFEQGE